MMNLFVAVLVSVLVASESQNTRIVRQAPANDFFGLGSFLRTFVSKVQPLISLTNKQTKNNINNARKLVPELSNLNKKVKGIVFCRDQETTGICPFMTCTLETLKENPSMENLKLMTEVLSDPKLRAAVADSPELVQYFCKDSGVNEATCKSFHTLLQVADKVLKMSEPKEITNPSRNKRSPDSDRDKNNNGCDDYYEYGGGRCGLLINKNQNDDIGGLKVPVFDSIENEQGSGEGIKDFEDSSETAMRVDEYYSYFGNEFEETGGKDGQKSAGRNKIAAGNCGRFLTPSARRNLSFLNFFKII